MTINDIKQPSVDTFYTHGSPRHVVGSIIGVPNLVRLLQANHIGGIQATLEIHCVFVIVKMNSGLNTTHY